MKSKYKIPYTLDKHLGDAPIQFTSRDGNFKFGPEDLTLRPFFIIVFSLMAFLGIVFSSSLSPLFMEGSLWGQLLVVVGYCGLVYFALREISVPGLYGYNVVFPFFNYVTGDRNRIIKTTYEQPYLPVSQLVGMHEPDEKGRLHFNRKEDCAYLFKITGTASNNTFDVDREQTINDYGDFLRSFPENTMISFITNTGGQNVNQQLTHLLDLYDHTTDRLIQSYIGEEIKELYDYVQDNFVTLHQYMLVTAEDTSALDNAVNRIKEFVKQNGMVISSMSIPSKASNYAFFKAIYGGIQNEHTLVARLDDFNKKHPQKSNVKRASSLAPNARPANRNSSATARAKNQKNQAHKQSSRKPYRKFKVRH